MARELLFSLTAPKDLTVQTFRSGGKGGQNQNKVESGVRIIHEASGARGESREERAQLQNKRKALRKLVADPRFKFWVHERALELEGKASALDFSNLSAEDIQVLLDEKDPDNFKVEVHKHGEWVAV